jgi:hypothetical protein
MERILKLAGLHLEVESECGWLRECNGRRIGMEAYGH